jgi:predicted KAP-like P-loop ATPase
LKKAPKKPKSGRKAHWFSSDRPIESARADVLGRSAFAARLADTIGAWDGGDSLVIALHGGWGTGKTSVKNMMLEKLRGSTARCPQIVEFSPWQVSGTGILVGTFFDELAVALGVGQKRRAGLLDKLSTYAKHLSFFGHAAKPVGAVTALVDPVTGGLIAAGGVAAEQSAQIVQAGAEASKATQDVKAKSLAELKRDLGVSLASLPRPVLVVIDDIDRLTTEEILQVFQLVKVNADFPNIIYLLLFERSIVEKALDRISGDRGHEFLQKIVQVEFHIPHAHRRSIERVLYTGLDKLIEDEAIKPLFDQHRWRDLYVNGIAKYFQNLRHVYRFLGSFSFHVAQFKIGKSFEANPVDLIGLETLRVFEPELYEQLPFTKRILTRDEGRVLFGRIKQEDVEAAVGQLLTHVAPDRKAQAKSILEVLFPPISISFDSNDGVSGQKQKWLREHRVCHADLFDKFFALVIGEGDLSQAELDRLVSLTADRNGFVAECRALLGRGLLEVAFERLDAFREQIPLTNMPALICALCDLGEELPEPKPGPFEPGLSTYTWRLIYFGLLREHDPKKRLAVLKEAFTTSPGIALPVDIVSMDQRTGDSNQQGQNFLVEENDLKELQAVCLSKIRAAAARAEFRDNPHFMVFLSRWFRWGDRAEVRSWVAEHVQSPSDAVWLLRKLLMKSTSTGAGGTKVHHHVHLPFVEQFVDLQHLTHLTSDLKPDDFEGLDKTALVEFRKALKRRAAGRPDDDWHWEIMETD